MCLHKPHLSVVHRDFAQDLGPLYLGDRSMLVWECDRADEELANWRLLAFPLCADSDFTTTTTVGNHQDSTKRGGSLAIEQQSTFHSKSLHIVRCAE